MQQQMREKNMNASKDETLSGKKKSRVSRKCK